MSRFSVLTSDLIYNAQRLIFQPSSRRAVITKHNFGFTIVELLIVIVVIGILAAIVTVAYNGIQTRATNNAKASELRSIHKLYELYKAKYGSYPLSNYPVVTPTQPSDYAFCLTTGYPNGYCQLVSGPNIYALSETSTEAQSIATSLKEFGNVPKPPIKHIVGSVMGPWAQYTTSYLDLVTTIKVSDWNEGCPSGMSVSWPGDAATFNSQNTGRLDCRIRLNK